MLLLLLLLADAAQSGKKAKKRRGSSLRLPPSSAKAGAAAYGLASRGEWVAPAQLPTLGPLAATRVGGKRAGEEAGPALHRRIKRDGHLHLRGLLSGEEAAAFRPYVVSEAPAIAAACDPWLCVNDWYSPAPSPLFTKRTLRLEGKAFVEATEFGDVLATGAASVLRLPVVQGIEEPEESSPTTDDQCGQGKIVMLSRFAVLSVSVTLKASPFQPPR